MRAKETEQKENGVKMVAKRRNKLNKNRGEGRRERQGGEVMEKGRGRKRQRRRARRSKLWLAATLGSAVSAIHLAPQACS